VSDTSPSRADAAAAGGMVIGAMVGCAAVAYGLGSLVGLAVAAGLVGLFAGLVVGLVIVYARYRRI
jgi:cation transporter-like permease